MINCVTIQGVAQRTATGRFIINEIALTTVSAPSCKNISLTPNSSAGHNSGGTHRLMAEMSSAAFRPVTS